LLWFSNAERPLASGGIEQRYILKDETPPHPQNAGLPRPTPFVLKSVCDFADPDKIDDMQAYAAYTSAKALEVFVQKYLCDISTFAGT
jgi:hypothetical protein